MHLTPLEIRKQPFRKMFRGFDPDAVNSFLNQVAGEIETLLKQNDELATQLKLTSEKLDQYVKIEKTLNQTLLTAQKATDEARVNAQKEAELIIKDAQFRARELENEARQRVYTLENDLIALRNQRDAFLSRFKAVLSTQQELLSTFGSDLKSAHEADETLEEVPEQPELAGGPEDAVVV
jgi:cell division initiation protein